MGLFLSDQALLPLSQVRKFLTLTVALQYLKYQIMLTIITDTIFPITLVVKTKKNGIKKGSFSSIFTTSFTCGNETLFNSSIFDGNLSNLSFERVVKLKVCINVKAHFLFSFEIYKLNT